MQLSNPVRPILILFVVTTIAFQAQAQDNIQQQFDDFYKNETSTWQEFKLVKMPKLKNFWQVVSDTIRAKEQQIATAKNNIAQLKSELKGVNGTLTQTQDELAASEALNDSIAFIGFQMNKAAYNTLVWLIIAGLGVGIVTMYLMYLSNHRITKDARLNLAKIEEEYTAHQEKARENQAKLKRELQTALNTLQEHRIKI